jgi:surfeit locus 1 family protein
VTARRKPLWLGAVFVAIGMAILVGLGVWQLQRLRWKEDLLAHVAALQDAVPVPAAVALGRPTTELDFTRVRLDCPGLERAPTVRLYAVEGGQAGDRLIAACVVAGRTLLVDRGFLAPGETPAAGRPRLEEPVIGVLRAPSGPNFVTPANNPATNRWYWRDLPAMAAALGASDPAPVTLMMEGPAPQGAPRPIAVPAQITNRHMEYALTWFGLAAALAGVYVAMLLRRRFT